jgi:hypothetical protein
MCQLDLHWCGDSCESTLDFLQRRCARYAGKAEARDLVEWRMVLGEARYAAGDVENEASRVCAALSRGVAAFATSCASARSIRSASEASQNKGARYDVITAKP